MITWVLTEDPTETVALAIELVEWRLGTEDEVGWIVPVEPPVLAIEGDAATR